MQIAEVQLGQTTGISDITAKAGMHGSISPLGLVSTCGNQQYTVTPEAGYYIEDVMVNGVSAGSAGSYTLTANGSAQTISATFALYPCCAQL